MRYGLALLDVEKPGRYEGLEAGAVVKSWDEHPLRVALCFPDVYEIGISHLGLPILYAALNGETGVLAERCYAAWPDMEALLRRRGWPLVTRESGRALRDFDLVGFTLQYELSATNVLSMLDLGGIPLLAADRAETDPLVIGGGPVAGNPEPLADFFDAFVVGEGEEVVLELARAAAAAKSEGLDRAARVAALGRLAGVYVPTAAAPVFREGAFAGYARAPAVRRRVVAHLDRVTAPVSWITPFTAAVHERLSIELARGCTRGCRFCQAGFLYRPVRERTPEDVRAMASEGLRATGHEEVGLLSLSTGDYTAIGPLLVSLMDDHAADHVSVSLPSLRVDSLDGRLLSEVARVRKTGFTLAPEAGTERLRRVINKNITEEEILRAVERVFAAGWKGLKLYFMVGLPFETRDDWQGIADLARKIARLAPSGKGRVSVSLSNFVPKPHTPFQWCAQANLAVIREAQEFFKRELKDRKIDLKWHDARTSRLEGVLARGDRRLGGVVLGAYRKGCRMDGWTSEFRPALWDEALAEAGLDAEAFLAARDLEGPLPWDPISIGVDTAFLKREWHRAGEEASTGDCRTGACEGCGLCDFGELLPRVAGPRELPTAVPAPSEDEAEAAPFRVRFRYSKTGAASLLSHLETVTSFHRGFRAAQVKLAYSRGFHPHPRLTLGPALPLGTETLADLGEMRLAEVPPLVEAQERANRCLPEGLRLEALWVLPPEGKTLSGGDTREDYRLNPSPEADRAAEALGGWPAVVETYWSLPSYPVTKRRRGKSDRVLEARDFVEALWVEGGTLNLRLRRHHDGTALSPEELLRTLASLPEGMRAADRILKTRAELL